MKIAYIDLETTPITSYNWGVYEQNAIEVIKEWYILCFTVKWEGGKTETYSLPDFPLYKKEPENDLQLVKKLWEVFNEADIILGHNLEKFDIKKATARFIFHGLTPPEPYKTVDTLKVARKYFKFTSNRLDALGDYLGLGRKIQTGGFQLWKDCMNGDKKAWDRITRYNRQDVILLEKVYKKLRGWMTNHPNLGCLVGKAVCPVCGGKHLQRRGFSITSTGKKQRVQCTSCGGWSTIGNVIKLTNIK